MLNFGGVTRSDQNLLQLIPRQACTGPKADEVILDETWGSMEVAVGCFLFNPLKHMENKRHIY